MSSSITDSYKKLLLDLFKQDLDSDGVGYYVGLSQAESITLTEDISSPYQESKFRHSLMSVKTLSNASFVVPNIRWTGTSSFFPQPFDNDLDTDCYVVNSLDEVFVCVEPAVTPDGTQLPSTIEPTSGLANSSAKTFVTSDGYKWRYLYRLSNLAISVYKTNDWIPIKKIVNPNGEFLSIPEERQQQSLQDSAVAGEIINLMIDSAGTGYTVAPTITITGNGTGAKFVCDINGGRITRVRIDSDGCFSDPTVWAHGSGYDYASAIVSTGDAVLRPVISKEGLNADPVKTLRSGSIMLQSDFAGDEFDTILAQNDFNQVGILRNLKKYGTDSDFTANTGNALKSLDVNAPTSGSQFAEDDIFKNGGETAAGKVVYHDTVEGKLYYYQDEETNFVAFDNTTDNTVSTDDTSAVFTAENPPDFDTYSGEILYINNLNALGSGSSTTGITREDTQTEDIRIVIQLG